MPFQFMSLAHNFLGVNKEYNGYFVAGVLQKQKVVGFFTDFFNGNNVTLIMLGQDQKPKNLTVAMAMATPSPATHFPAPKNHQ
ncbi:hypothetical protein FRX31_025052 [Thalictrum thalictroides]|uniref:Uncharacterized protein n=1 Tax=Thalictrum thalictroides TaxID=46969 RepID=A0A7J6VJS0_THATH|nr:hypothetical protein FRX31_025052 [Thalictrum thalictroides]